MPMSLDYDLIQPSFCYIGRILAYPPTILPSFHYIGRILAYLRTILPSTLQEPTQIAYAGIDFLICSDTTCGFIGINIYLKNSSY